MAAYDAAGNTSAQSAAISVKLLARTDLNGDGTVGILDLSVFLSNWGLTGANASDFNRDGVVNILDLSVLLTNWTR